jgi:hypothetical protein
MSPRLIVVNGILGLLAIALAVQLVRELTAKRPLPAATPQSARGAGAPDGTDAQDIPEESAASFNVVASRNPFNPSRTEKPAGGPAGVAPAAAPVAKPLLHGIILDDSKSRAFLEDTATKRVFGYAVGDTVGGGRLDRIEADRVVIARPEGPIEVMLRDPAKPRPPPPAPSGTGSGRPSRGAGAPGVPPGQGLLQPAPGVPADPGAAPVPGVPGGPGVQPQPPGETPRAMGPNGPRTSPRGGFLRRPTVPAGPAIPVPEQQGDDQDE